MPGKNGLLIQIQQEKSYHNDELFYLGFENVLKMHASVMEDYTVYKLTAPLRELCRDGVFAQWRFNHIHNFTMPRYISIGP